MQRFSLFKSQCIAKIWLFSHLGKIRKRKMANTSTQKDKAAVQNDVKDFVSVVIKPSGRSY